MLRSSSRQYVCWNCLSHSRNGLRSSFPSSTQILNYSTLNENNRQDAFGLSNIPISAPQTSSADKRPIRERLRDWVATNDPNHRSSPIVPDLTFWSPVTNSNTRAQSTGSTELDNFKSDTVGMVDATENVTEDDLELSVVSNKSQSPGDLVEMKQPGSRTPLFAIYLGYFGNRHHFYSSNGRWVISMGFSALFSVSRFVSVKDLKPILALIPPNLTVDQYEDLRKQGSGPSREAGSHLIYKMKQFVSEADEAYQSSLNSLDRARTLVSDGKRTKYLSLFELADMLLPRSLKKDDIFPPSALYAVHTALYRNDFIFRPLSPAADVHRQDHIFEIFPYQDLMMINRVALMIREYISVKGAGGMSKERLATTAFGTFILKAREIVHANREKRSWTPHGILSPTSGVTIQTGEWSRRHIDFIHFLEWWASYGLFEDSSHFHADGALMLRALELYEGARLDQSCAWTFLQELGLIPPWEIPSRYKVRFPEVKIESGGGLIRATPARLEDSTRPDVAVGARREWSDDTVFCIDAPSTFLIDDGVSLERTDKPDEFWIHIHTADPASGIQPNSELAQFLELIPENIYLPGHFQAMLPSEFDLDQSGDYKSGSLVNQYSLAKGRPALTFSAKVNEKGDLLDYKVEPGTLHNIAYLDPKDVSEFCNEPPPPPASDKSLVVGQVPDNADTKSNRPMISARDLDDKSKEDLLTLYRLAEAVKGKRLQKGAWPSFLPNASVTVAFEDMPMRQAEGTKVLPADPYIKIGYDAFNGASVVSNTMVLAGEIAARWCSDRNIPLPYRRDMHSKSNMPEIYDYATKTLYPLLEKGIQPTIAQRQEFSRLTGGVEMSTEPGPYFMLGLDMYAKATSPLRRFSDLIVHWQIHAALAHERKVNRRIDAEADDLNDILPFTSETLPETLSLLRMREKMARTLSRGTQEWMLMALVRAWKFEGSAPQRMRLTVESQWRQGVLGRLDLFDLSAILTIDGLDGLVLIKNVKVGDKFDVELADINVHARQIFVKALKHYPGNPAVIPNLDQPALSPSAPAPTPAA
ncbi:3'-5' RNA exonuclease complex component [Fusarium torreyae]|uniref:3'-5' RNA exonuclease complex component n=1 Tax=Fusarium torreyae TaxID=1237075 RepID=A0A9W8VR85_9HYPO|nr:3'-5' RNA exonuclease complex component [Fusarium torreyae]